MSPFKTRVGYETPQQVYHRSRKPAMRVRYDQKGAWLKLVAALQPYVMVVLLWALGAPIWAAAMFAIAWSEFSEWTP